MRVLWFVPTCFSAVRNRLKVPHNEGGWWIESAMSALRSHSNIEFGVAWLSREIHEKQDFFHDGVHYYCIPENKERSNIKWKSKQLLNIAGIDKASTEALVDECCKTVDDFEPNIIHAHGSERPYGLVAEKVKLPVILSMQGILTEIIKCYFGKLSLNQQIKIPSLFFGFLHMRRRAVLERRIFHACKYFMGRTLWDKSHQVVLNPKGQYFHCAELLRPEFYKRRWHMSKALACSIYTTTSCLPYKGIDTLLDAVAILRGDFPNLCLRLGGNIPYQGFGKFLRRKVIKLGIENIVKFLGWIPAENIADELESANLFVMPSFIDNSPNSLAEAQMVGTPVVASTVGGIPSMVIDNLSGLLFPPGDAAFLSVQIRRMIEDKNLALKCSEEARQTALARHDEKNVVYSILDAYEQISRSS